MLESVILGNGKDGHISVMKFRHNDKASYKVLIDGELNDAEMSELIDGLIAMRDSKQVLLTEQ